MAGILCPDAMTRTDPALIAFLEEQRADYTRSLPRRLEQVELLWQQILRGEDLASAMPTLERHAVALALDRQEKATENGVDVDHSAVQYVTKQLGLEVCAIARLTDLLQYLSAQSDEPEAGGPDSLSLKTHYQAVVAYRKRYGVD